MSRGRNWCFTLNNYTEDEETSIKKALLSEKVRCAIYGREGKGETQTPHLQGYISFKDPARFAAIKKVVGVRAHVEVSNKGEETNRNYCKKENDYEEFGRFTIRGKRTDLDDFCEAVRNGCTDVKYLRDQHRTVFARCSRFALGYLSLR